MGGLFSKKTKQGKKPDNRINIRDRESIKPNGNTKLEAKIVLVGNSGVGKTCIATRYKEGKFTNDHKPTVGASYF